MKAKPHGYLNMGDPLPRLACGGRGKPYESFNDCLYGGLK